MARPKPKYSGDPLPAAYDAGREAAGEGRTEDDNPHQPSGHERDTTFDDELHFNWYQGFWDGREARSER